MGGSLCWSRGRSPPLEEEEVTETMCEGLTASLIPCLPAQLGEEEIEKIRSEIELEEGSSMRKMF